MNNNIKIFAGNSNIPLAEEIASHLGMTLGQGYATTFSNGETRVNIEETVRGCDVYIVQSLSNPVDHHIMELLIMMDAVRRASAGRITAVIPYFAYARQDRKTRPREPISAKLLANLITVAGANRVITMDLHAGQIQGFFDIPVDPLQASPILAEYIKNNLNLDNSVVVSPDVGGVARARAFASRLHLPIAIIDKRRPAPNELEVMYIVGDVKGKTCIVIDDMIDTGGTLVKGADALLEEGAIEVYACATHPVFSGNAIENIKKSHIKKVIVTNTILLDKEQLCDKIEVLSVAKLFAEAIDRIHNNRSVSELFV
ncbi:MAG: ribose-phosphate pyrophosphokinase [bacterium]|nr:ribose-phosphate pyrophosphokinase [bacterium]